MHRLIFLISACILTAGYAQAAEKSPMPLAVGNRWEYSVSEMGIMSFSDGKMLKSAQSGSRGSCVEEIIAISERRPNGDVVYEDRMVTKTEKGINTDAQESVVDSTLLKTKDGIFITAGKSKSDIGMLTGDQVEYDPPLVLFGTGLGTGKVWRMGTFKEGKLTLPMYSRVAGRESVTVPAGTFDNCVKMYVTCKEIAGFMGEGEDQAEVKRGTSVTTLWISPGIGTVKEDSILQATMEFPPDADGNLLTMTGTNRKIKELLPGYRVKTE